MNSMTNTTGPRLSAGQVDALLVAALSARQQAYAPYSSYQVGAALLTADDVTIVGCNVENAAYPAAICAERVAMTAAIAQGHRRFVAMAVATTNGGTPCGICRQVMAELGPAMFVYACDENKNYQVYTVAALLPAAFLPKDVALATGEAG